MDSFVHRENVRHLRQVLEQTRDEAKRQQILKLLAEEEEFAPRGSSFASVAAFEKGQKH